MILECPENSGCCADVYMQKALIVRGRDAGTGYIYGYHCSSIDLGIPGLNSKGLLEKDTNKNVNLGAIIDV